MSVESCFLLFQLLTLWHAPSSGVGAQAIGSSLRNPGSTHAATRENTTRAYPANVDLSFRKNNGVNRAANPK